MATALSETATVNVSTSSVSLFYVTATNSVGEGGPSNIVTNTPSGPTPTPPLLVLTAPTMSTTNPVVGNTITIQTSVRNGGGSPLVLTGGALTLLPPGATTFDGPYVQVVQLAGPITIVGGNSLPVSGAWTVLPTNGTWLAYMAVNIGGTWTAGPPTPFTVSSTPTPQPPPAPTNLRVVAITASRLDLSWQGTLTASTEVERSVASDPFKRVATVSPGTLHYTDSLRHKPLAYRVRQRNVAGVSGYSNVATYNTP